MAFFIKDAYCDDIICDWTWAIKSISTTTIIKTEVPPTEIVGEIPAKLISANGNRQISVRYIAPKTVNLAKTESI